MHPVDLGAFKLGGGVSGGKQHDFQGFLDPGHSNVLSSAKTFSMSHNANANGHGKEASTGNTMNDVYWTVFGRYATINKDGH